MHTRWCMATARALLVGLTVTSAMLTAGALYSIIRAVEQRWFPVLQQWQPLRIETVGADVVVFGQQVKPRDCEHLPPLRAETEAGRHLRVVSASVTAGQSWDASQAQRDFGPWTIHEAAGLRVRLYAEHRCHPFWTTFSQLGYIDTRKLKD